MKSATQRSSNFELLRIISMLAIVAGHFMQSCDFGHGVSTGGGGFLLCYALGSSLCIAVNLFVMTGAWFMVDYDFKFNRVLRLYCQTLFYSWLFFVLEVIFLPNLSLGEKLRNLEPFFGFQYWFVTVYIMLLLVAPYLKKVFLLPRPALVWLLTVVGCFMCVFSCYPSGNNNVLTNFFWFSFLFLFIGYVKKEVARWSSTRKASVRRVGLVAGLIIYAVLVVCRWIGFESFSPFGGLLGNLSKTYLYNIQSIPNVLCAFGIFLWFATLEIGCHPLINKLAKNTFGVYLIHCPLFNHFSWLFAGVVGLFGGWMFPVFALVFIVSTYFACVCLDAFRARFLEPILLSQRFSSWLVMKVDGFYEKFGL